MKRVLSFVLIGCIAIASMGANECGTPAQSASGVSKATASVSVGSDGLTVEQRNVSQRITEDNKVGAIKHLYIISAYSGQVLLYSTVKGKVSSSGKRLNPSSVAVDYGGSMYGFQVAFPGGKQNTPEVLGDDGTYGPSVEYLYWWDTNGIYHQQYVTGGMILHVSAQPIAVKSVVINLSEAK